MYPLKFTPILKEIIWGGKKIPSRLGMETNDDTTIGEYYIISGLKSDTSVVSNGKYAGKSLVEMIAELKGELVGKKVYQSFDENFPLLFKFIDANNDLSIQVHPNDEVSKAKHNAFGKTEMWYVIDAEEGAGLISGFSKKTSKEEIKKAYETKSLMPFMNQVPTHQGDTFFIPAGKVHSIGKGNLIAEIQQTSDITYRVYDFDRVDKNGNPRELHHELALDVMNYQDDDTGKVEYETSANESVNLATCKYFTTNIIELTDKVKKDYSAIDSFVVLMNVGGSATLLFGNEELSLNDMEAILIPASVNNVELKTNTEAKLLEVFVG